MSLYADDHPPSAVFDVLGFSQIHNLDMMARHVKSAGCTAM